MVPAGRTGNWLNHACIRTAVASRAGGTAKAGIAGVRALSTLYWCDRFVRAVVAPGARKARGGGVEGVVAISTGNACRWERQVMIL